MTGLIDPRVAMEAAQEYADRHWPGFRDELRKVLPEEIQVPERFLIPGWQAPPQVSKPKPIYTNLGEQFLGYAMQQRGRSYQWGGVGNPSFDCSGLVQWAARKVGIQIPRTTYEQINSGVEIDFANVQIGDLVFSRFSTWERPEHVSIWAGNGKVFEAGDPIGFYDWGDRGTVRARRIV